MYIYFFYYFVFLNKWQKIVSTFSNLEYELIDQERRQDVARKSHSSHFPTFLGGTAEPLNSIYSCLIDRNRIVKYTSTSNQSKSKNSQPQTSNFLANVNLFYELLQSMPELSKFEIRLLFLDRLFLLFCFF